MLDTIGVKIIGHTKMFLGNKNKKFLSYARCYSDRIITRFLLVATFLAGFVLKLTPTLVGALDTNQVSGDPGSCSFSSTVTAEHSTTIGLGENATDFGTTKITTVCQNSVDHQVYAIGYSNNTDGNTNLINSSNNLTIPTGTGTGNVSNWSMKISKDTSSYLPASLTIENSFDSNHVVPNETTLISSYDGATDGSTGSSILTTYSAKASTTQPGGNYAGKVKFTLTATLTYDITIKTSTGIEKVTLNGTECTSSTGCVVTGLVADTAYNLVATVADGYVFTGWGAVTTGSFGDSSLASTTYTIGDGSETLNASAGPAIQNLNTNDCTSTASTVYDSRDGHSYVIQRLLDGNCWMMENLDLGRNALTTNLTSENTNIATTVTATTFNSWKRVLDPSSLDDGAYYPIDGTDSTSNAPYGTLYNYYVASAGTTNSQSGSGITQYDICPAGWRLPTGGASGELGVLYNNYNSYALMRASIADNGAAFALAGIIRTTGQDRQGEEGTYWSNTRSGQTANTLAFRSNSQVFVTTQSTRNGEYSIRCILKKQITDLDYLQDFKNLSEQDRAEILSTMKDSTVYHLTDNRDNKSYAVTKLKDGNIWMAENLDLGRTTLSNDLTSANTNISTTVSASTFNSWIKTSGTSTVSSAELIPVSGTDSVSNTAYGTLYNYCATSAGTHCTYSDENALFDICPAGWRLPTHGEHTTLTTEYNTDNALRSPIIDGGAALALAGQFRNSTPTGQETYGFYWASTKASISGEMAILTIPIIRVASDNYVGNGNSIRCLVKNPTHTATISYGTGITDVTINGISIADNGTIELEEGTTYTINAVPSTGYSFSSWSTTSGTIGSTNTQSTTYSIGTVNDTISATATFTGTYIQNLSASNCTSTASTVFDSRDMHPYVIKRLDDGNCWMIDNLDLGRTDLTANLTSSNTNISTTIAAATFNSWRTTTGTQTYDAGEFLPLDGTDETSGTAYGTIYNYYAASAGTVSGSSNTIDATSDICPAGWRLPTGGNYDEFWKLYEYYNSNAIIRAPISDGGAAFARPGWFTNNGSQSKGTFGAYWASTAAYSASRYNLSIGNSVTPSNNYDRGSGYSIRCILKEPKTIAKLMYLQDFNKLSSADVSTVLSSMSYNTTYNLKDVRDNHVYSVAKLKDGNIWMVENLDLGRTELLHGINDETSNVGSNVIVDTNTFSGWKVTAGTGTTTAGEFINIDGTDATSGTPYGTLYNYYAATAGTVSGSTNSNANYDICPAGWRMPYGGDYGEFAALYAISDYNSPATFRASIANGGAAFALPGSAWGGAPDYTGYFGSYWTSTMQNNQLTYRMSLNQSSVGPATSESRSSNVSVRCVAKIHNRTISDLNYMQEFAQLNAESKASVLASMSNNVTYSLTDVRDNKTYRIAKFKDGNIWMAENLDLGRTDISVNLNSINTNIDTPSISAATFNGWRKTTGTNTYTAGEFINVSGNDPTNSMPYGTLYNYYAASAGTINGSSNSSNASYDICPAGWRLPTGGSNSELYAIYENYPNYDSIRGTVAGGGFAITFPGYFYSAPADPGIPGPSGYARASYWSSSYYNSTNMSVLTVDINSGVTDITPADINTRGGGNPIRCIAK